MSQYHKILGLEIGATKQEIKAAFRILSKKYHPDLNKDPSAQIYFIKIHEAYKFLYAGKPYISTTFQQQPYSAKKAYYNQQKSKAETYAREKAREAYRKDRMYVQLFLKVFRLVSYPILALNFILAIDFVIFPLQSKEEKIVSIIANKSNKLLRDVHFETEVISVKGSNLFVFYNKTEVNIEKTMLFEMFKGVEVGCCDYISEQSGKYFLLRFLTPFITILLILANFVIKIEDLIFSSFILAFLMSAIEIVAFFSQSVY